jgi:hypothetical protein
MLILNLISANSQGSQDAFRPPSTPNNGTPGMDGFPHNMNPNYMNSEQNLLKSN